MRLIVPADHQESFLGDLEEEYRRRIEMESPRDAGAWYWQQAFSSVRIASRGRKPQRTIQPGDSLVSQLLQNLRFALRMLQRSPGFSFIAVLTLTLGIGFTTAIFSVARPVLFSSLPYSAPDRLAMLWEQDGNGDRSNMGYLTFRDFEARSHSLSSVAAMSTWQPVLGSSGEPERLTGQHVTARFFEVLGVQPQLGRGFLEEEDQSGKNRVAVLSYGLWQRRFSGDPNIVGRQITLSDNPYLVVGVMPASFESLLSPGSELWSPLGYNATLPWACRTCRHLRVIGRLKPEVPEDQAARELNQVSENIVRENPTEYVRAGVLLVSLQKQITENIRPILFLVIGAVGFVFLIACANTANLMIARGVQRQGEFALRTALGAERHQLIGQMLTESVVLSFLGSVAGLMIAWATIRIVVANAPAGIPRLASLGIDGSVLAFTAIMSVVTGVLFGLVPALLVAGGSVRNFISDSGRHSPGRSRHLIRRSLVVGEVCLALTLLMGAMLLVRSLEHLLKVDPGFDERNLLTMEVEASGQRYRTNEAVVQFFDHSLSALRAIPGVTMVGAVSQLPLGGNFDRYGVEIEDHPRLNPEDNPGADRYGVTPGYIEAMRISLIQGRAITSTDTQDAPPVIVVNQTFARREWPAESPLGKRVRTGGPDGTWRTVVGVVGDVRHVSLEAPQTYQIYIPETQWENGDGSMVIVLRTRSSPAGLVNQARDLIWSIDRGQPITNIATMEQVLSGSTAQRRFILLLFQWFAGVALVLSAIGIYGVLAAGVAERTREFGIRSALGASRHGLLRLVLRQGLMMVGAGLLLGIPGSLALNRTLRGMLYGVSTNDATALIVTASVLATVGVLASLLPALRATRADPLQMMRTD
ncbi:MAG: ABC transporter permease [Gemmatimonadota bacterium]